MRMNEGEVILFGDRGREINDDFPGIFIASVLPISVSFLWPDRG